MSISRREFLANGMTSIDANLLPENQRTCHICHEDYLSPAEGDQPEAAVRLSCGHTFGATCIRLWLDTTDSTGAYNRKCPFHCLLYRRTEVPRSRGVPDLQALSLSDESDDWPRRPGFNVLDEERWDIELRAARRRQEDRASRHEFDVHRADSFQSSRGRHNDEERPSRLRGNPRSQNHSTAGFVGSSSTGSRFALTLDDLDYIRERTEMREPLRPYNGPSIRQPRASPPTAHSQSSPRRDSRSSARSRFHDSRDDAYVDAPSSSRHTSTSRHPPLSYQDVSRIQREAGLPQRSSRRSNGSTRSHSRSTSRFDY